MINTAITIIFKEDSYEPRIWGVVEALSEDYIQINCQGTVRHIGKWRIKKLLKGWVTE